MSLLQTAFIIFTLAVSTGESTLSPVQEKNLDEFISKTMQCRDGVGFSIALVKDGQTVLTKAYGMRDYERQLPMKTTTLLGVASLTKAFTSTLISDFVAKGDFSWDTPLREVIPDFALPGDFRTKFCSLRDALSHKIGFPVYRGVSMACLNVSREELVRRMQYFPPQTEFRHSALYSNYNYVLAARAMEVKAGKTWEQLMREKILDPLGMPHAKLGSEMEEADWDEAAWAHTLQQGKFIRNPESTIIPSTNEVGPAVSLFASAEDMALWMKFHLSGGKNATGSQIFNISTLRETYMPSVSFGASAPKTTLPRFPVDNVLYAYGMGWANSVYRGRQAIVHIGAFSSYNCLLTLLMEENMGVWACTNSPGNSDASTATQMATHYGLDLLLGVEPWLNTTTTCTFPAPWIQMNRNNKNRESQEPEEGDTAVQNRHLYIGDYDHPGFGTFRIFGENGTLQCRFGRFLNGELRSESGGDEERLRLFLGFPLTFRMYSQGWTEGYPMDFNDRETVGEVPQYMTVKVSYLQPNWPPTFVRQGYTDGTTATTSAIPICPNSVSSGQRNIPATAFYLLAASNLLTTTLFNRADY